MLSTDHAAANQEAIDAAKGMGMNPPSGPNAKQKADYDKMSKMSDAGLNKTLATRMVADHQKDIAEYKKVSKMKDAAGEYASGQIDIPSMSHVGTFETCRQTSRMSVHRGKPEV